MKYVLLLFLSPSLLFSSSRLEMYHEVAQQVQEELKKGSELKFEFLFQKKFDFSDDEAIERTTKEIQKELEHLLREAKETKDQQKIDQIRADFFLDTILLLSINNFAHIYQVLESDPKNAELIIIYPLSFDEKTKQIFGDEIQTEINKFIEKVFKETIKTYIIQEQIPKEKLNDYLNAVMQGIFIQSKYFYSPKEEATQLQKLKMNLEKSGLQKTNYYKGLVFYIKTSYEKKPEINISEKLLNLHNDLSVLYHALA